MTESNGQSCKACVHFLDYSDVDPEEPVGYCAHPFHFTAASPHRDYGGHWAFSDDWCEMWEQKEITPEQ